MSRSRGPQSPARYHDDFDAYAYDYGNYDQYERDDYYDGEEGRSERDQSRGGTGQGDYDTHPRKGVRASGAQKGNVNFGSWEGDATYEAPPRRVHQIEIDSYGAHEDTKYAYRDEGRRSNVRTREPSPVKRVRDEERGSPVKGSVRDDRVLRDPRSSGRHTEESSPIPPPPPPPNGYPGYAGIPNFHPTPGQKKAMQEREKRENENPRLVVKNTTISIGPTPAAPVKRTTNFDLSPDRRPAPPQHGHTASGGPVKAILNAIKMTNTRDTLPRGKETYEEKVHKENQERSEDIKMLSAQNKVSTNPFMKSNERKSGGASMRNDPPARPHNVHEVVHKMNTGDWPIKLEDGNESFREHRNDRSYSR